MSFNVEQLKEKLGEDYEGLETYVKDLVGQRDSARNESINGRKSLKAEVEKLRGLRDQLFDRLGISEEEDLENLPDIKGQAEATKAVEARLKRMEKELNEKSGALEGYTKRYRDSLLTASLVKAINEHEWVDKEVVEMAVKARIGWVDDEPFYQTDKGAISIEEGVKLFAQDKPQLLKSTGAGGSGYNPSSGNLKQMKANPFAKGGSFNLTEQGRLYRENPQLAEQLKIAAASGTE
jgi:hypothetical protein